MPFVKGQSGNPGGQHKSSSEFRELARQLAPGALERLKAMALNKDVPWPVRLQAEIYIMERAHGKPEQHTTSDSTVTHFNLTDEQKAEAVHLLAERARAQTKTLQ